MKKIDVKENEQVKIGPFKLLLNMIWNADEDIEAEWEKDPNRKVLEATLEKVDKMEPKAQPVSIGKKGKTRKISEFNKNDITVKKAPIKENAKVNYNKRLDEEREHE